MGTTFELGRAFWSSHGVSSHSQECTQDVGPVSTAISAVRGRTWEPSLDSPGGGHTPTVQETMLQLRHDTPGVSIGQCRSHVITQREASRVHLIGMG